MGCQILRFLVSVCLPCMIFSPSAAVAAAASSGPDQGCSSTFHVWQPGQDARQMIQKMHLKMDNLTSYTRAELLEMKAHISEELSRVHNWTYTVDRRLFQIQIDRMDDEMMQMKFSSSIAKTKMQLDRINRKISDLEHSLFNVESRMRTGSEDKNTVHLPPADRQQQQQQHHQGVIQDMGQMLRNSVSDLKAEWILLKREIESLKKRTGILVSRQTELSNDTISLKLSLTGTDSATKRLQTRFLALTDHQDKLGSKLEEVTSDTTNMKRKFEEYRLNMMQSGAKIFALQSQLAAIEKELANLHNQSSKPTRRTLTSQRHEGIGKTVQTDEEKEEREEEEDEENLQQITASGETRHPTDHKNLSRKLSITDRYPIDCHEIYQRGYHVSSVYQIHAIGTRYMIPVYCEMTNNTGYTLIQRRIDGSLNFNRGWSEYKQGFGNPYGEMWVGNDLMHRLSDQRKYTLRIDFWDWDGEQYFAEYSRFYVDDEKDHYRLHVGEFTGSAGDSMSYHNMMAFSTEDVDNDLHERHCAAENKGGWWYNSCFYSQLNGLYHTAWYSRTNYADGIVWYTLKDNEFYSLKKVEMKLKPQTV
ncbi:angiopoietin-related protein 1 [Plakobranchus ocellatus]|uniref:Angiopoietin-related protein 1 n=1 Tax=Plakobranchus ocellatus TaxID=259542 RepID=A0AAV4B7K7_9GAST|nr:angiopoietin-related protein 1 [Plakobranchus ocellatus]